MLYQTRRFLIQDPYALLHRFGNDQAQGARFFPAINFWHSGDSAAITAELPGVAADDVDVSVKDNVVALKGERKPQSLGEKEVWHKRERSFGKFSRAVRVPFNVDPDKTEASMTNGVLQVVLHRRDEDKPRRIQVRAS